MRRAYRLQPALLPLPELVKAEERRKDHERRQQLQPVGLLDLADVREQLCERT
jgi:hypothetical protein